MSWYYERVGYPYCLSNSPRIVKENADTLYCKAGENVIMQLFEDLEDRWTNSCCSL
jgi:hypothetical protein